MAATFEYNDELVEGLLDGAATSGMPGEPTTFFQDVLDALPGIGTSAALKMGRGTNTIMGGGFAGGSAKYEMGGSRSGVIRGGARNLMYRPRNVRRFATQSYFGMPGTAGGTRYTPFFGAGAVNSIGRGLVGQSSNNLMNKALSGFGKNMTGLQSAGGEIMSRGFTSRIAASSRLANMSSARQAAGGLDSARSFLGGAGFAQKAGGMSQNALSQAMLVSGQGVGTARMGGYMARASGTIDATVRHTLRDTIRAGGNGSTAAAQAYRGIGSAQRDLARLGLQGGEATFGRSLAAGVQAASERGITAGTRVANMSAGLKLAGASAAKAGSRLIPYVGWALLAHDVAKLTVNTGARAAAGALRAVDSYAGNANTGLMQGGFTDTEATMTARSRGVAAIQNSRLNMRSVLGSEAGAMSAHFN